MHIFKFVYRYIFVNQIIFLQNTDPLVRRKRDLWRSNETLGEPIKVFHSFKVISPDDIEDLPALTNSGSTIINVGSSGMIP